MMQKTALLVLLAVASTDASSAHLRHRELWGSSSGNGWSFWGSLLQLLDHMHTPCPPGHLHHKDSDGKPLPPGECWQDLHPHHHHHSGGSHSGGGGGGGGGGGSSYNITYSFVECEEGDAGCYQNILCQEGDDDCMEYIMCEDDDQDCQMWIKCDDDSADCMANVQPDGWSDDGHGDDVAAVEYDDGWSDDGWTSASYASKGVQNSSSTPVWPFLVAALVAGVVGVMFVVSRRKRRSEQDSASVSDGTASKRKRLFSGFGRKKQGALNEDFDNEDNYVEMSR